MAKPSISGGIEYVHMGILGVIVCPPYSCLKFIYLCFVFRYSASKSIIIASICTCFDIFNVPVFWPILVMYFFILFFLTMRRQIEVRGWSTWPLPKSSVPPIPLPLLKRKSRAVVPNWGLHTPHIQHWDALSTKNGAKFLYESWFFKLSVEIWVLGSTLSEEGYLAVRWWDLLL